MADRILVVDDHAMHRMFARLVLEGEGYEVCEAADARSAELALVDGKARLALVDIELPDASGLELVRRLRAVAGDSLCIVAFSGHSGEGMRRQALAAGFDGYILKPMDGRGLLERVAQHLAPGLAAGEIGKGGRS